MKTISVDHQFTQGHSARVDTPELSSPALRKEKSGSLQAEMEAAAKKYVQNPCAETRTALIMAAMPLTRYLAARYPHRKDLMEDLASVGTIGLIKAVDQFDVTKDTTFATYAMHKILGEIKHYLRDRGNHVRIPRWLQELSPKIEHAKTDLTKQLGRKPTVQEIAAALQVSEEDILEVMQMGKVMQLASLDAPMMQGDGSPLMLSEICGAYDSTLTDIEHYADLRYAVGQLDERERQIIKGLYFDELSQAAIAEKLNISQMHVSRLAKQACLKLKTMLYAPDRPHVRLKPQTRTRGRA